MFCVDFKPDLGVEGLSLGAILGIVVASCALVAFIGILTLRVYYKVDIMDKGMNEEFVVLEFMIDSNVW